MRMCLRTFTKAAGIGDKGVCVYVGHMYICIYAMYRDIYRDIDIYTKICIYMFFIEIYAVR